MNFAFYPKHEYACTNLAHCPHLGGAAIGSVVSFGPEKLPCGNRLIVTRRVRIAPPRFAIFERDSGRRGLSLTSDLWR